MQGASEARRILTATKKLEAFQEFHNDFDARGLLVTASNNKCNNLNIGLFFHNQFYDSHNGLIRNSLCVAKLFLIL